MNPWSDASREAVDALDGTLRVVLQRQHDPLPSRCPYCLVANELRVYFDTTGIGRPGSFWVWCESCRAFSHGSIIPPDWWANCAAVDRSRLASSPAYLSTLKEEIDRHWMGIML
jgi:hypothetical protein